VTVALRLERLPAPATTGAAAVAIGAATVALPATTVFAAVIGVLAAAYCLANPERIVMLLPLATLVPAFVVVHLGGLPDQVPSRALVCVGTIALAFSLLRGRARPKGVPRAVVSCALAYWLYLCLLLVWHPSTSALRGLVALSLGAFMPLLLVSYFVRTCRQVWNVVATLVIAMDAAAVAAIVEEGRGVHFFAAHAGTFFHADDRGGWLRAQGVFPHPIVLGSALALAIPFASVCLVSERVGLRRLGLVSLPVQIAGVVVTVSRGPWIGVVVGVAVLACGMRSRFVKQLIVLVALALALMLSPAGSTVGRALSSIAHPADRRDAYVVAYRQELLQQTLREVRHHPLAARLGMSDQITLEGTVAGNDVNLGVSADNTYAYYLLRLGVPGASLLVLLLISISWQTWRRLPPLNRGIRSIAVAALAAEVSILVTAASVSTLSWEQLGVLYWLVAGIGLVACRLGGELAPQGS
jgi:O-antigen ligase